MKRLLARVAFIALVPVVSTMLSCRREQRRYEELPPLSGMAEGKIASSNRPGHPGPTEPSFASGAPNMTLGYVYDKNAWAIAQGKQLYTWFNCSGCHFHGGGGIGPALMDEKWFYGSSPDDIYTSIVEGRPEGMPSYRGKINDAQVFQIVAYVRSMSALTAIDALPSRDDHMSSKEPESMTEKQKPVVVPHP
jgi:cytochrome c oxidase cbb3-type subunit III